MFKKKLRNLSQKEIDEHFMKIALDEGRKSLEDGNWPVGCVIVIDGEIISRGRNHVYSKNNKIHHAEIEAISLASEMLCDRGRDATLYVTYAPCPMCMGAILLNHFGRLVHGPDLDQSSGLGLIHNLPSRFTQPKYKVKLVNDVLESDCKNLFLSGKPTQKIQRIINESLDK